MYTHNVRDTSATFTAMALITRLTNNHHNKETKKNAATLQDARRDGKADDAEPDTPSG